ncbi:MAG: DivIVA domain-containing protein [Ilumatobacter sp.]|nr:DivIVA domain-containing protein [Ilumatobacter sp.]
MDMNPQRVRTAEFKTVKRGLDPSEVEGFLHAVADELERAQNQSTAMEARARAAVARLQELSDGASAQADESESESMAASPDQSETISRTLLLAQRTADTTIADAKTEAERIRGEAGDEASRTLESTRDMASSLLDEAREEARKVGEEERVALKSEVDALAARRDFLESDVDHMEQFLIAQRNRLREAANELIELTERVPSGLGEVRRPLLSASDDDAAGDADGADDTAAGDDEPADATADDTAHAAADETPVTGAPVSNAAWSATDSGDGGDADAADETGEGAGDSSDDLWLPDDDDDQPVDAGAEAGGDSKRGFRLSFGED